MDRSSARAAPRLRHTTARASAVLVVVAACLVLSPTAGAQDAPDASTGAVAPPTLADAQSLFYRGRYEEAAAVALAGRPADTTDPAHDELRSSALLFQLKRLLEGPQKTALKACKACPDLIAAFMLDVRRGQALARARLKVEPGDDEALFFLGKLDLNYVWLVLGPLRKRTGWDEYWEARRSLDAVLARNPNHTRARVARAWIDYIVDTRMPWGTRWVLGGGNRKKALSEVRAAVARPTDFFTHAEATFALWDMHVRERDLAAATEVARELARQFPDNRDVAAFLEARQLDASR
jgi:tetratricopeptide (TPR) repeat protein